MTRTRHVIYLSLAFLTLIQISCMEKRTTDPQKTYNYWAGNNPPSDLEVINGQYWESAHWTKEYIMFMKIKPTTEWWNEFIKQNQLLLNKGKWTKPSEAPVWFNPTKTTIKYNSSDIMNQSIYLRDTLTGVCFIYELQL